MRWTSSTQRWLPATAFCALVRTFSALKCSLIEKSMFELSGSQTAMADRGLKGMIDVGRPFLDHVISAIADAGITDVILVIGPEHDEIRAYYDTMSKQRVTVDFAVQERPLGTASRSAHCSCSVTWSAQA